MNTLHLERSTYKYDFRKTRIITRDISKYNANILIHLQKMEVRGQVSFSKAKTWEIAV